MAGVAEETAAVGEHAHKAAEQPQLRQNFHLLFHTVFLIQKPPAAAVLHFTRTRPVLKIADHGGHQMVVAGIEVVENGGCQLIVAVQAIQKFGKLIPQPLIANAVESGVRPQGFEHAAAVAAQRAHMKLLHPAAGMVHDAELHHHAGFKLIHFRRVKRFAPQ